LFSLLVVCQGLFGGMGLLQVPEKVASLFDMAAARFIIISCIAFTATKSSRTASMTALLVFSTMHLLRSSDEKKDMNGMFL
jgi:hypothetical protein